MVERKLQKLTDSIKQQSHNESGDESRNNIDGFIDAIGQDMSISCLIRCTRSTYPVLASLNKNIRYLIKSGEIYKLRKQEGVTDYCLYFSYDKYDRWQALFDLNTGNKLMHFPESDLALTDEYFFRSLAVGTEILCFPSNSKIYSYRIVTQWWSLWKTDFHRNHFACASHDAIAIFAGGYIPGGYVLSSVEMYDSTTKIWKTLPDMNKPTRFCSAVFIYDKFYVMGGFSDEGLLTCGEEFSCKTNKLI